MARLRLFISYRRDSDLLRAALVTNHIENAFNQDRDHPNVHVFRDNRLRVGAQWPDEVRDELGSCGLVLVLIGPGWLAAKDRFQRRRIDQDDDWVRMEIELALQEGKTIIPIAFEEELPPAEALPESIAALVAWQAAVVRDFSIERDLEPVLNNIRQHLENVAPDTRAKSNGGARLPYPDPPMKFPPPAMPDSELLLVIKEELPEWRLERSAIPGKPSISRIELRRDFEFRRFSDVVPFMAEISDFAEKANHHPRWENIFKTLSVYLTTWDIGHRVSTLDIMLASFFDRTYARYLKDAGA
jgi:pterin-4a-carbinolamine dehydratase